ncbi:MAG: hypothetical protein WD800_02180 [Dehalococcoidia bacterium]
MNERKAHDDPHDALDDDEHTTMSRGETDIVAAAGRTGCRFWGCPIGMRSATREG